jgi:Na+/H+ antiporter NhaC
MQLTQNPVFASFLILFLVLWFLSFRINKLKPNLTKNQKEEYKKKFKLIKNITIIWVALFVIMVIVWPILQNRGYVIPFWNTVLFFITIGTLFLTISSAIHYWIIESIRKKK